MKEKSKISKYGWLYLLAAMLTAMVLVIGSGAVPVSAAAAKHTVTFNGAGGTPSVASKQVDEGAAYGALATATRTGYTFAGWFTAASGGTQVTEATVFTAKTNQTIYAHWTALSYTVTLDPNGGSVNPTKVLLSFGGAYSGLPTPTRSGYEFTGWFTKKTGGTQITASTKVTTAANHTLYAQWKMGTYTVTLNPAGGSVSPASLTVKGAAKYGSLPTPTRTGYTFLGWFTAASGGTQVTKDTTVTILGAHTLYAHWKLATFTIMFDPNGGKISTTHKTVSGTYGSLPTPDRLGYAFTGWYTQSTGGTQITEKTVPDSNRVLYAHWQAADIKLTVAFNAMGGMVSMANKTVIYGGIYGTLPVPTKSGYLFDGWYGPDNNRITESSSVTLKYDHTLYARWAQYDGLTAIYLNRTSARIKDGKKTTLVVSYIPDTLSSKIKWESSNEDVATVTSRGVVRGIDPGTAVITATTADGRLHASCTVTVQRVRVKKVVLDRKSMTVKKGKKRTLEVAVLPVNATNQAVIWRSSNSSVATVSTKGVVRGIRKGRVTITVKSRDGSKVARCTVYVK